MRGEHVSKSIEDLVKEAKNLAKMGVKELMLIAQELTYYGLDLYKKRALGELLDALCEVEGIEWIRMHYAYPSKFPLDVIDVMARQPKICNYLDMPLQHAADDVLKRMKRQITQQETRELINAIREKIPNITLRTTFLVGFPGETDADVENLIQFVEEMKFDRVGVFQYSHEEDTSAHVMEDSISPEEKAERANRVMEVQGDISYEKNQAKIGQTFKILIDKKEGEYFYGRTEGDSPEVDNEVLIDAKKYFVRIGDFVTATIVDAEEFDLYAEPIADIIEN